MNTTGDTYVNAEFLLQEFQTTYFIPPPSPEDDMLILTGARGADEPLRERSIRREETYSCYVDKNTLLEVELGWHCLRKN